MIENQPHFLKQAMKRIVLRLLEVSALRFAVLFLIVAVAVSVMIVMTIDFLWDGRFNTELEFAGVVTPFLDGLFLVVFVTAMFNEIREEVERRKIAEDQLWKQNDELDAKVKERTQQLLEAQEDLVRKEGLAMLGKIAGNVGHELRNPLGVMNNAVYFLRTVLSEADATTREYLDIIHDEIASADRILSDLLDAVRTKPPHPETVEIGELLSQSLHACQIPAPVTVQQDIPATCPLVLVDPLQMQQVFRNLISNGIEAMPEGGTLEIRASAAAEGKAVIVSIRDEGAGISPEHRARLFEPLFTTKARRIGLGLAVVKNLTEANGGSVAVQSEPGKGSTFFVTLPGNG
jgi:signal transduction histidine kinase